MGVQLDDEANRASAQIISAKASPATVFVIQTDEERMIASHTVEITESRQCEALGGLTKANPMTSTYSLETASARASQDAVVAAHQFEQLMFA